MITGSVENDPAMNGADDLATAQLIDRARLGEELDVDRTTELIAASDEARRTLALGDGHADPGDIAYATRVDAFDFAMEVRRAGDRLYLERSYP